MSSPLDKKKPEQDSYFVNRQDGRCMAIRQTQVSPLHGMIYVPFEIVNPDDPEAITEESREAAQQQVDQIVERLNAVKTPRQQDRTHYIMFWFKHVDRGQAKPDGSPRDVMLVIEFGCTTGQPISEVMDLLDRAGLAHAKPVAAMMLDEPVPGMILDESEEGKKRRTEELMKGWHKMEVSKKVGSGIG
jgi:hypothetical protein